MSHCKMDGGGMHCTEADDCGCECTGCRETRTATYVEGREAPKRGLLEPDDHRRYRYLDFAGMRVRVDSYRMAVVQDGEWEHFFEWKHSGVRRADDLAEAIWAAMSGHAEGTAPAPDAATIEACARAAVGVWADPTSALATRWDVMTHAEREMWRDVAKAVLLVAAKGAGR